MTSDTKCYDVIADTKVKLLYIIYHLKGLAMLTIFYKRP